ncbi:MAG TPA: DUF4180 domain-containing protein [Bacteroidales bacterium]|nr:DUF4180 domain-containing protein [Bacteroidales bacterium]
MQLILHTIKNRSVAEVTDCEHPISDAGEMLDILAEAAYLGSEALIVRKEQLNEAFYDLKTGLAGDILQKFSNYRMKLAITGDFTKLRSKSLRDFILESNRTGRIIFVESFDAALKQL